MLKDDFVDSNDYINQYKAFISNSNQSSILFEAYDKDSVDNTAE
jgi:hypothetical protein